MNNTEYKKYKCPVKWFCKALDKWIVVSKDAVYSGDYGWICDCGTWVKKPDSVHVNMTFGKRVFLSFLKGDFYEGKIK